MTKLPYARFMILLILLLTGVPAASAADNPGLDRSLSIRFPAFSLNAGEKIAGIKVRSSHGQIIHSCLPGRWTCETQGNSVHCYCLHQSHAIAMTGRLPELFVRNIAGSVSQLTIEATVEYLDSSGNAYSKDFRESELIIK